MPDFVRNSLSGAGLASVRGVNCKPEVRADRQPQLTVRKPLTRLRCIGGLSVAGRWGNGSEIPRMAWPPTDSGRGTAIAPSGSRACERYCTANGRIPERVGPTIAQRLQPWESGAISYR